MSTCLLAGRTNPAQIAKVRAQRNLRAARQILTWLGGRETGKLKRTTYSLICSLFNFLFPLLCASYTFTQLLFFNVCYHFCWIRRELRSYGCILLTELMFFFFFVQNSFCFQAVFLRVCEPFFFVVLAVEAELVGVGVSLARP